MPQEILNNGETGLSFRNKLNSNFTELYTGSVAGPASSVADNVAAFANATGKLLADSGLSVAQIAAIIAEVIAARGNRTNLNDRVSVISNFASPNAGGIVVGNYYDGSFHGSSPSTSAGVANRIDLGIFYTSTPLRIDQIGVAISTGVAGALGRVVIYGANASGWPDAKLYESPTNLDFSATGYIFNSLDFTFQSGTIYWLGLLSSSTATYRTIPTGNLPNFGLSSSSGTSYFTVIRRTVAAFANPLPNNWGFLSNELVGNTAIPSIRFRAAA